jgi:microcystin-dependent protein
MASYAYTFTSGDTVTPTKLNNARTISDIVDADIKSDAAIAGSKLATAAQQALVPAGAVMAFAMNSAPSGWLAADGSNVNRTTYAALFSAIGTTYGAGDGSTTFALPDMRGYFVRGSGTNGDATASGTFGAKQADSLITHTHTGTTSTDGAHTHTHTAYSQLWQGLTVNGGIGWANTGGTLTTSSSGSHSHTMTTSSMSPAGATETRPKNIAMLYCIKF